jgi:hypothetical protein
MNISKNMRNFSVVSSATKLHGYDRNTCRLNGFHEADSFSKNMGNFSVVSSATKLLGYHRNTRPLNDFHEADSLDKIEFEISLPGVCPLPTSPPRLKGHHVPPLKPNPKII